MPRLINADALYKTIDQEADFYGGFGDNVITASELRRCIEMVPTIDAVPVTRCEYCYAYRKDKELARAADLDEDQYCALLQCEMPPNGYCYYGKKKEDIRKKTVEDKA